MPVATSQGILNPRAGKERFELDRRLPSDDLREWVETYWFVRWNLPAQKPFAQETLPHPNVQLVIGTHRPGVHGPATKRFVAELEGEGQVVGVKFRAGGFYPFWKRDVVELSEQELPLRVAFGVEGAALEADVLRVSDDDARVARIEHFLRERSPTPDPLSRLAARAVEMVRVAPAIARTSQLARLLDTSTRTLDRVFRRYVGVGPKWVIRRFRVHEACERIARGEPPCWATLAQELGYFDQPHFIRDFKSQVGRTPADYARECAKS